VYNLGFSSVGFFYWLELVCGFWQQLAERLRKFPQVLEDGVDGTKVPRVQVQNKKRSRVS